MQPAIGRIVHYRSHGSADGTYPQRCRAAMITDLDPTPEQNPSEIYVSLCVVNPTGLFFDMLKLYDPEKTPGTWHWHTECDEGVTDD